jgi:small subunit ribosomal protein S6
MVPPFEPTTRLVAWANRTCSPRGPFSPEEAALREYEVMLILEPDSDESVVGSVTDRITGVIGGADGSVAKVDRWGKRRLAYEIDKRTEGYYLVVQFTAEPTTVSELERVLSLTDGVVRAKVVRRDAAVAAAALPPASPKPSVEAAERTSR